MSPAEPTAMSRLTKAALLFAQLALALALAGWESPGAVALR